MPESAEHLSPPARPAKRRRPLPATVLPAAREDRRGWGLLSALVHVLIIVLLIGPITNDEAFIVEQPQGAGGAGPAGGGGGGKRGTGGVREQVHYVEVAPAPAAAVQPQVAPPPIVPPQPKVIVPPTPPVKALDPVPEPKVDVKAEAAKPEATAPVPGAGGGTGRDGSAGTGPGSGGGVGSGIGTGRGSGIGPGTGGGTQANYPPTAIELFIPPIPIPDKVRGFHLIAEFDVDSTGKVVEGGFHFTPTPDRGYNKKLDEVLKGTRFRPGTTPDGKPIRMKTQIVYDF